MPTADKPFKRLGDNSWDELLQQVNEKLQDPPEGTDCESIDEIDTPEECHRWSKDDIQGVHDKLNEMPGNCFDFEDIPDLWKVSTIEDIEDQLDNSWCDCEEEGCNDDLLASEREKSGIITVLGSLTPVLWTNCEEFKDKGPNVLWTGDGSITDQGKFWDFCDGVRGTQISVPGVSGRNVKLGRLNEITGLVSGFFNPVTCDGIIDDSGCSGPHSVLLPFQRFGFCPNWFPQRCGTDVCEAIFDIALALSQNDPTYIVAMQLVFEGMGCDCP